jgi:hypothetical protein
MTTLKPELFAENLVASINASLGGKQVVDQPQDESK